MARKKKLDFSLNIAIMKEYNKKRRGNETKTLYTKWQV